MAAGGRLPARGKPTRRRSGASALFVSDGDSFAPRRERFLCLRRPHFFQQRKKWGKERRQKLRFCTSSARYAQQRFPAYSRGHNLSSPLSVKRTACTLTGAEADAAACPSHGRRFSLLPPHPQAFPLDGSAVLNDTPSSLPLDGSAVLNDRPVACQIRGPTDPQGDRCPHIPAALAATYPLRCFAPQWARFDNRHSTSEPTPTLTAVSGSGASGTSDP